MEWNGGERIFKRGDGVSKILLKNGNIGATSRPSYFIVGIKLDETSETGQSLERYVKWLTTKRKDNEIDLDSLLL